MGNELEVELTPRDKAWRDRLAIIADIRFNQRKAEEQLDKLERTFVVMWLLDRDTMPDNCATGWVSPAGHVQNQFLVQKYGKNFGLEFRITYYCPATDAPETKVYSWDRVPKQLGGGLDLWN